MKTVGTILISFSLLGLLPAAVHAAATASQTFKIGVYIPAIPGVNVPVKEKGDFWGLPKGTTELQTTIEHVQREDATVVLKTCVAK